MSYPILFASTEKKYYPAIAGIAVAGISIAGNTSEGRYPFTTQGLGVLSDAISCTVLEERNGMYELEMEYPLSGIHFNEIELRAFIFAKPNYTDNPQPFRIYKISKPLNGVCTIYAQHISYDLGGFEVPGGLTASGLTASIALLDRYSAPFKLYSTRTGSADFITDVPASVRSWLGGKEGSILDLFGGEWHWDMFNCTLSSERGTDRGVTIRYGKNLTSLSQDEESSNVYSAVRPYYVDSDENVTTGGLISTGITLDERRILFMDCSAHFGDEAPTVADLNSYARSYISSRNLTAPHINLTLDFVQMKSLADRVDLCDTVTIQFEQLGVSAQAKCIKTVWDVLKERYTSTTFGDAVISLADTVNEISVNAPAKIQAAIRQTKSALEKTIEETTAIITGNLGGYVIIHDADGDGYPDEILIMDTADITTASKVWRWNKNGLGYSSTGYDGTYGTAITADGQIVADYITTGTLSANRIQGGVLQLGGLNNEYGVLQILDANGNVIGLWNKDGAIISGDLQMNSSAIICNIGKTEIIDGIQYYGLLLVSANIDYQDRTYFKVTMDTAVGRYTRIQTKRRALTSNDCFFEDIAYALNSNTPYYLRMNHVNGVFRITSYKDEVNLSDDDSMVVSFSPNGFAAGNRLMSNFTGYNSDKRGIYITSGYIHLESGNARIMLWNGECQIRADSKRYIGFKTSGSDDAIRLQNDSYYLQVNYGGAVVNGRTVQTTSSSSKRYKHNIKSLSGENNPHRLLDLKPIEFTFNDDVSLQYADMKGKSISGFIAEDVDEIYPSAVIHNKDGEVESWDERRIIPPMLALIQEQQKKIDEMTARIERLEALILEGK